MSTDLRVYLALTLFFMHSSLRASDLGSWQCMVADASGKQWTGKSNYQRSAYNHALESCKKESSLPATCKASADCGSLFRGLSARMMWRCSAIDHFATSWVGRSYPDRDHAALAAKAVCESQSRMPESCYINLLSCLESHPVNPQIP